MHHVDCRDRLLPSYRDSYSIRWEMPHTSSRSICTTKTRTWLFYCATGNLAVILARGFCCYPVLKGRRSNPGYLSFKRFSAAQLLHRFRLFLNSTDLCHHFDTKRIKIQPTEAKLSSTEKAVQTLLFCREGQFCLPLVNGCKAIALHRSQLKSSWSVP